MRHTRDHQTGYLFDPWAHLGPKRRQLLEHSWAGLFREYLLNELPVEKIASYFHPSMGRPSKELYTALGTLLLQHLHDLSDAEVVCTLAFDARWHYALDITAATDEHTTMAERTLREYRRMVIEQKLDGYLFETLTDQLIEAFDVDTAQQRLDSSHIRSNMRRLSRIGLFAATIRKFLLNLKHRHRQLFDSHIPAELAARYLNKGAGCFSHVKPSEARKTLRLVGEDLFFLVQTFRPHQEVYRLNSFHLLERLLHEQCTVSDGADHDHKVQVKPSRQIASDSLQNPSDPDATYDGHHKAQGYQVQVMETFVADQHRDRTKPNLITHVQIQPAHRGDSQTLIAAIDRTGQRGCAAQELLADAAYGSDENVQAAAGRGIEVVSPVIGKKTHKLGLERFRFHSTKGTVTACPGGHRPQKSYRTKKARFVARFSLEQCHSCPQKAQCPVQFAQRGAYLRYTAKQVRVAHRRADENTQLFRDRYRWRAGIEAANSHLKSDTGARWLRVRGLPAVRYCVTLKALGLNILRATSARMTRFRAAHALAHGILAKIHAFSRLRSYLRAFLNPVSSQLPNLTCQRAATFN